MSWSTSITGTPEDVLPRVTVKIEKSVADNYNSPLAKQRAKSFIDSVEDAVSAFGDCDHITVNCYGHIAQDNNGGESYIHISVIPLVILKESK